jgi:cyclase
MTLRPRIIPCLLIHKRGLVKTVKFGNPKYVGDPLNAVRIYNEKWVDEIMVLDIDATAERRSPDLGLIAKLAFECRMPLCYGGGVSTPDQIEAIVSLGVEKVAIGSAIIRQPGLLAQAWPRVGRQTLVAVLDVRRIDGTNYEVFVENGRVATGLDPRHLARRCADDGAGEIVVNMIDRDGTMEGYDLELAATIREAVDIPLTFVGGAGSLQDIRHLVDRVGVVGAAAGSLFVFKGPHRAVLITYPRPAEKAALWGR